MSSALARADVDASPALIERLVRASYATDVRERLLITRDAVSPLRLAEQASFARIETRRVTVSAKTT